MFGLNRKQQIVVFVTSFVAVGALIALILPQQHQAACSVEWPEESEGPTLSIGEVGGTSVTLNFIDNSEGETGFDIFRNSVFIDYVTSTSGSSTGSSYTYKDTGVTYNTPYTWVVKAVRGDCEPLSSNPKSAITLAARPLAPTLTAGTNSAKIVITTPDENPTITEYAVFNETLGKYLTTSRARQSTKFWSKRVSFGGAAGITDSGLVAGTKYTYKIIARNLNKIITLFSPPSSILISSSSGGGGGDDPPGGGGDDPPGGGGDDPPGGGGSSSGNNNEGSSSGSSSGDGTNSDQPAGGDEKSPNEATSTGEGDETTSSTTDLLTYIFIFLFSLKIIILLLIMDTDKRVTWLDDHVK